MPTLPGTLGTLGTLGLIGSAATEPRGNAGAGEPGRAALQQAFRSMAAPTLLFVGTFYAVLSGTIFLNSKAAWVAPLWFATVALGVGMAGTGLYLRRRTVPDPAIEALMGFFGAAVAVHILFIMDLAEEAQLTSYLAMLMASAGFVLLPKRVLAAVHIVAVGGYIFVAETDHIPLTSAVSGTLAGGFAVGWAANVMRTRFILHRVAQSQVFQGTLHESEERFRSLAETAKDGILNMDAEGRLGYLNPAGMNLLGLRPEDLAGRSLSQHLGASAPPPAGLVGTSELQVQRRDGSMFTAELSLARADRGGKVAYTGVLRDITERKRAVEANREAEAREAEVKSLRSMNEFKTRFLNMAAHELNTPLTPLRLQLHLLQSEQMGPLTDKQRKSVTLLDRNVARLGGLVAELLEVARLQGGALRLQVHPMVLDGVIDEVLESFGEAARRVGVALSYSGQQNLSVQADRNRTTQVLVNLVSNGIKFTPSGGRVNVHAEEKGEVVEVRVTDTGLGLSPEQQGRLFHPFTQVHDPMSITAAGTGLGLYISKELVEAQGGRINVSSPGPAQGSTFSFTLPAAEAQAVRPHVVRPADEDPIVRRLRELI